MSLPAGTTDATAQAAIEREVVDLHSEYSVPLLRYARAIGRDADLARDAVQEGLMRYFMERRLGRTVQNPRAWIYRVTRNYILDMLNSPAAKYEVEAEMASRAADSRTDAETALYQSEAAREVVAALTPREAECLRLRAEDLSYAEIASVMGIQPGTVAALLARAHHRIRKSAEDNTGERAAAGAALLFWARGGTAYSS